MAKEEEKEKGERRARGRLRSRRWQAEEFAGKGTERRLWRERGVQKLLQRTKEGERESLHPFVHRHRGLTRVSSMFHPVFLVLLSPFGVGERETKGWLGVGGAPPTTSVRERCRG